MTDAGGALGAMRKFLAARRQRGVVAISGVQLACLELAGRLLDREALGSRILVSAAAAPGWTRVAPDRAGTLLGTEREAMVFDLFTGFDADAIGAASGTVSGGGLLVLLVPDSADPACWPDPDGERLAVWPFASGAVGRRLLHRAAAIIAGHPALLLVGADGRIRRPFVPAAAPPPAPPKVDDPDCLSVGQRDAVDAVMRVARGHRRRPLVITAHRGRGKSAALGIAAARLIGDGFGAIAVTGPRPVAAAAVFRHAARILGLPDAGVHLHGAGGSLRFIAADELVRGGADCGLLLVDEAAAIPAPILEGLLERFPRIAFASTVHGYEGSGRGFAVRFRATLDRRTPHWREMWLEEPIRWAAGDPAERFVFDLLLLDAAPADDAGLAAVRVEDCIAERLDRDVLAADESLLRQVFGLLVLAHYRTRPSDLRRLLDAPNLEVHVLRAGERVAATALVAREGGFDDRQAAEIFAGMRRPHGHLLPESLAFHLGVAEAATRRYARVVRIAVHPALRRRGLGRRLLAAVVDSATGAGLDFVGTSFGAEDGLLQFWHRAGLAPVRVGVRRGAASGLWSVMMTMPLGAVGRSTQARLRAAHRDRLLALLGGPLAELDVDLADCLLDGDDIAVPVRFEDPVFDELATFAWGGRTFEAAWPALEAAAGAALTGLAARPALAAADRHLWLALVVQRRSWGECAAALGLPGREAMVRRLRAAVTAILDAVDGERSAVLASRLRPRR